MRRKRSGDLSRAPNVAPFAKASQVEGCDRFAYALQMLFWQLYDGAVRRIFGKEKGDKILDAQGVLVGAVLVAVFLSSRDWLWAFVSAGVVVLSAVSLWRERRSRSAQVPGAQEQTQAAVPPEQHGAKSRLGVIASNLSRPGNEPLPPWPGTTDDESR